MTTDNATSRGIIVLGMHRSGTSATAHLLGELGCSYGGPLVKPRSDNPRGYWEHAEVVETHDDFLSSVERRWDDPRPLTTAHFASPSARSARLSIASLCLRAFAPHGLWVLKDPRQCRLLPLWDDVFSHPDYEIHFLHVVRDPYAVAKSLEKRDGLSLEQSLLLWLQHNLESERYTRSFSRVWIGFEDLVADAKCCLETACSELGLAGEMGIATKSEVFDRILDPSQVHYKAADPDSPSLRERFPWVDRAHKAMSLLCHRHSGQALDELDRVAAEFETAELLFYQGMVVPAETYHEEVASDRRELKATAEEAVRYARSLETAIEEKDRDRVIDRNQLVEAVESARKYAWSLEEQLAEKQRDLDRLRESSPTP